MEFFETSKQYSFKKSTYINLRWIGIVGQLIAVNFVYLILNFKLIEQINKQALMLKPLAEKVKKPCQKWRHLEGRWPLQEHNWR